MASGKMDLKPHAATFGTSYRIIRPVFQLFHLAPIDLCVPWRPSRLCGKISPTLSGIGKPIGIAEYQLVRALPEPLDTCLPGIEEIEAELGRIGEDEL